MGFMRSYKRLDNLCRDMNSIGVTGYIEDMEHIPNGVYYVPEWKDDYYQLKHYRHIRNQIAHENDADEDSMCSYKDEIWIEDFYHRIMTQRDPLALYRKTAIHLVRKPAVGKVSENISQKPPYKNNTPAHNHTNQYTHKPQYIPAKKKGRRMHKLAKYGVMILLVIIVLEILLLTVLFVSLAD